MRWPSSITWGAFVAVVLRPTWAYIPATASNATAGFDDDSTVSITWFPNGAYSTVVSYQQHGAESSGISKGALVRVQEEWFTNDTWGSDTPWIALIQCDFNSTPVDLGEDIFTKVRDRGALAALLYSNSSDGCLINDEYLGDGFSQIFDIFTTKKSTTALLIQSQFSNVDYTYTIFNSTNLNNSYTLVSEALARTNDNRSPYLVASLHSATAGEEDPNDNNPRPSPTPVVTPHTSDPSQSLAMIILYVIVSLVSTLFLIVIISGAIRAFRHPERYGPRLYDPTLEGDEGQGQTRAAGLTRAILDTFPVVKFGRQNDPNGGNTTDGTPAMRPAGAGGQRYEMKGWDVEDSNRSASTRNLLNDPQNQTPPLIAQDRSSTDSSGKRLSGRSQRLSVPAAAPAAGGAGVVVPAGGANSTAPSQHSSDPEPLDPAAIGRETCPICIVDFEEGDDLRVLPCEGKHRFHKDCVDPWLLELSSSCPICREDFQALETMAAANTEEGHGEEEDRFDAAEHNEATATSKSRFTRYIRFAQKRRRSQRDQNTSTSRTTPYTDY
ncbi:hypothetical protein CPB86DRAFT_782744 [Serendipita vermifera]|nr:hypothetical protein CPB86DRAFT_782744 [Serendipita vermifera]